VPLSYVNSSENWSHDERKILEAETKGPSFLKMSDQELIIAGTAVCYQISKITGILLPTQVEKAKEMHQMVGKFIRNNKRFRLLTLAEVALAASWNAAGEFKNRVKHYNNELTLDYLGELLNEYCRHKHNLSIVEKMEIESMKFIEQKVEVDPFFWEKEIELRYQQYLKNSYQLGLWLPGMYCKLADLGLIEHNYFVKFLMPAYNRVIDEMNLELADLKTRGANRNSWNAKALFIEEYKYANQYVLPLSKRLAVRSYFQYCHNQGIKNLFIEEK
jgi:hypothetical protein